MTKLLWFQTSERVSDDDDEKATKIHIFIQKRQSENEKISKEKTKQKHETEGVSKVKQTNNIGNTLRHPFIQPTLSQPLPQPRIQTTTKCTINPSLQMGNVVNVVLHNPASPLSNSASKEKNTNLRKKKK